MGFAVQREHWTHTPSGEVFIGKTKAKEWYIEYNPEKPNWTDGSWFMELVVEPLVNATYLVDLKIEEIVAKTGATDYILLLSPRPAFAMT